MAKMTIRNLIPILILTLASPLWHMTLIVLVKLFLVLILYTYIEGYNKFRNNLAKIPETNRAV